MLTAATAAQAAVSFVNFGLPAIGPQLRHEFGLGLPALGAILSAGFFGTAVSLVAFYIVVLQAVLVYTVPAARRTRGSQR